MYSFLLNPNKQNLYRSGFQSLLHHLGKGDRDVIYNWHRQPPFGSSRGYCRRGFRLLQELHYQNSATQRGLPCSNGILNQSKKARRRTPYNDTSRLLFLRNTFQKKALLFHLHEERYILPELIFALVSLHLFQIFPYNFFLLANRAGLINKIFSS